MKPPCLPSPAALASHRHALLHRVLALRALATHSRAARAFLLAVPVTLGALACVDATVALTRLLHPLLCHLIG